MLKAIKYIILGTLFGLVLTKTEAISWFRMQEMFRFQSFHMYGIIGSAILTGIISLQLIKRLHIKTITGKPIKMEAKQFNKGTIIGGLIFGMGWALTGACPGPIFAQIGTGASVAIVLLLSAIAGTWVYSFLKPKLPH